MASLICTSDGRRNDVLTDFPRQGQTGNDRSHHLRVQCSSMRGFIKIRDAPNFRPPKIFRKWPKSAFITRFHHRNNTAETVICDDAKKKRGQHTLVWISANMTAVWTFFNVSEKDPRKAICKNSNALILMKLVHSHSHKVSY